MKKIFSVLIAVVMVLSLSAVAFAENSGKITITNATKDQTYTAYRILDLESYDKEAGAYTYKVNGDWTDFVNSEAIKDVYLSVSDTGIAQWVSGADIVKFAKLAKAHAKENNMAGTKNVKAAADGTAVIDGLALGWYLVDSTVGTLCSINTTDNEVEIADKNEKPSIDKEVQEDSDESWGKTNDADIGQVVNFRTTVTKQKGAINYRVHDKMQDSLTLLPNSIKTEAKATIITTGFTDGCTFEVLFDNEYIASLADGETMVITYSAILNEKAKISTEYNVNKTKLSYGVNEDMETEWIETKTYTYTFDLVKTNSDDIQLEGAEFKLYEANGTTEIPVIKLEDGKYRVAVEGETGVSIVAGKAKIIGLDSDTYYLEETKAPEGYNKLEEKKEVVINKANLEATLAGNHYENGGVQVINNSGTVLPSTGGMGTTIFTVTGIILIVGAAIVLFARKRMSYSA